MLKNQDIKNIKKGDLLHLTDFQSLQENSKGIDYEVLSKEVMNLDEQIYFYIFDINYIDDTYKLTIIGDELDFEVKFYFYSDDYPLGFRSEILEKGHQWLFLQPENEEDFFVEDLEYAHYITPNFSNDLLPEDTEFKEYGYKGGFFYTKDGENVVSIREYKTDDDILNQFLMITEKMKGDKQGYISIMQGCVVDKSDIELFSL